MKDSKTYIELQLQGTDQARTYQIRNVKSATGEVLMKDDEIKERWGQYFNLLMNKENQRVGTEERDPTKQ